MTQFNKLPQFFEELKIDQKTTVEDLYFQLKQQIPINYLEVKFEEGNYCGSTNPKWKNKPLCERYFFIHQEREIQLDIPHELMDKLGLEKGVDLIQPLYLDPKVLDRSETYKGITIENEKEIILINPNKLVMKEQGVQTDLINQEAEDLKNEITRLKRELNSNESELNGLRTQLTTARSDLATAQIEVNNKDLVNSQLTNANNSINQKNSEISNLTVQLNSLQTQNNQLQNNIQDYLNSINSLQASIQSKDQQIASLDDQVVNKNSEINGLRQQITDLINQINSLQNNASDLSNLLIQKNNTINNLTTQVSSLQTNYNTANNALSSWVNAFPNESANQVQVRIDVIDSRLNTANSDLEIYKQGRFFDYTLDFHRLPNEAKKSFFERNFTYINKFFCCDISRIGNFDMTKWSAGSRFNNIKSFLFAVGRDTEATIITESGWGEINDIFCNRALDESSLYFFDENRCFSSPPKKERVKKNRTIAAGQFVGGTYIYEWKIDKE